VHAPTEYVPMTAVPSLKRLRRAVPSRRLDRKAPSLAAVSAIAIAALAAAAVVNKHLANKAERDNPPAGRFLDVNGIRLHYVERGTGDAVVLLHGNGSMIQDFESSGLIELAAKDHRVIVFDRPGFGHSERPRSVVWTQTYGDSLEVPIPAAPESVDLLYIDGNHDAEHAAGDLRKFIGVLRPGGYLVIDDFPPQKGIGEGRISIDAQLPYSIHFAHDVPDRNGRLIWQRP